MSGATSIAAGFYRLRTGVVGTSSASSGANPIATQATWRYSRTRNTSAPGTSR